MVELCNFCNMRYLKRQVSHCQLEKRQSFQMLRKNEPISVDANWLRRGVQDRALTVFKGRFGGVFWWHLVWRAGPAAGGRERLAGAWGSGRTRFENMTPGRKFWCFQNVQMSMIFKHHTFSIIFLDCMLIFPACPQTPLGPWGTGLRWSAWSPWMGTPGAASACCAPLVKPLRWDSGGPVGSQVGPPNSKNSN